MSFLDRLFGRAKREQPDAGIYFYVRCATCGEESDLLAMEPSYGRPDAYFEVPEGERDYLTSFSNDDGRIRNADDSERRHFLRALLSIPIRGEQRDVAAMLGKSVRDLLRQASWGGGRPPGRRRAAGGAAWYYAERITEPPGRRPVPPLPDDVVAEVNSVDTHVRHVHATVRSGLVCGCRFGDSGEHPMHRSRARR
jgi:hypothetical protein